MSKSKDLRETAVAYQKEGHTYDETAKAYLAEHPDDTQQEVSVVFGCCPQAISKAYKRLGITHKKTHSAIKNKIQSK